MKKLFIILAAVTAFAFNSPAQFSGSKPISTAVVSSVATLATLGTTNITTAAPVGRNGFAVTATIIGTNASTANVNFQVLTTHNGTDYSSAATDIGNIAMNGTTVVRKTLYVLPTTINNVTGIKLVLTNAHTATVTISNITVTAFQ